MKQIVYKREIPAETAEINGETVVTSEAYLQKECLAFTDADKEIQIAEALKYSHDGTYTIEDDGEPEPVIPPTNDELAASIASLQSANAITFVALCDTGTLDAVTASEHAELFAEWAYPIAYTVGQFRRHNGKLYKCVQAHTSQESWTPDTAASLWSVAADPAEEWPAWSQPVGAHDAYAAGDKVSHNGKHWTSDVAGNVWEPGVSQWTEYTE